MSQLVKWLFETKAVRACAENKPFWYTSGTIGPYYINTHFLYGSEEKAVNLLCIIDNALKNPETCSATVLEETMIHYSANFVYKGTIDTICKWIKENIGLENIDYISGGERRDWFFSLPVARLLNKPHITIFKDGSSWIFDGKKSEKATTLQGKKVLHIADLITEASSYARAWIPAIEGLGGAMCWSLVVIDRMQGGSELLQKHNIKSYAMVKVDASLFDIALKESLITAEQYTMLSDFIRDPNGSMRSFLVQHPEFLENALAGDPKTAARAQLCLDKNFYKLDR